MFPNMSIFTNVLFDSVKQVESINDVPMCKFEMISTLRNKLDSHLPILVDKSIFHKLLLLSMDNDVIQLLLSLIFNFSHNKIEK